MTTQDASEAPTQGSGVSHTPNEAERSFVGNLREIIAITGNTEYNFDLEDEEDVAGSSQGDQSGNLTDLMRQKGYSEGRTGESPESRRYDEMRLRLLVRPQGTGRFHPNPNFKSAFVSRIEKWYSKAARMNRALSRFDSDQDTALQNWESPSRSSAEHFGDAAEALESILPGSVDFAAASASYEEETFWLFYDLLQSAEAVFPFIDTLEGSQGTDVLSSLVQDCCKSCKGVFEKIKVARRLRLKREEMTELVKYVTDLIPQASEARSVGNHNEANSLEQVAEGCLKSTKEIEDDLNRTYGKMKQGSGSSAV